MQASGLAPLLPAAAGTQVHVPQLRTAPATLDFLLAAASSLQAAARRDPRTFSLFLEPAASLLDARRSPTLRAALSQSSTTAASSAAGAGGSGTGAGGSADKLWRFAFDAVMPAAARLDGHSSVTLEVDLDQAFGTAHWPTLPPARPGLACSPPSPAPVVSHRGVLLTLLCHWHQAGGHLHCRMAMHGPLM